MKIKLLMISLLCISIQSAEISTAGESKRTAEVLDENRDAISAYFGKKSNTDEQQFINNDGEEYITYKDIVKKLTSPEVLSKTVLKNINIEPMYLPFYPDSQFLIVNMNFIFVSPTFERIKYKRIVTLEFSKKEFIEDIEKYKSKVSSAIQKLTKVLKSTRKKLTTKIVAARIASIKNDPNAATNLMSNHHDGQQGFALRKQKDAELRKARK